MNDITELPIDSIIIAVRTRREVKQIEPLAQSIKRLGLLHPVVINSRRELVAGCRRLEAVKRLGWTSVPVRVVATLDDATAALRAEMDENTCREFLTVGEVVELCRRIEELEKPAAKERQTAGTNQHTEPSGKLPQGSEGRTRDKVAAALGVSGRTYEKAKAVVTAAEAEPEKYADLPAKMEATSVDAAHKELVARRTPATTTPASSANNLFSTPSASAWAGVADQLARVATLIENAGPIPTEEMQPWNVIESLEKTASVLLQRARALRKKHRL